MRRLWWLAACLPLVSGDDAAMLKQMMDRLPEDSPARAALESKYRMAITPSPPSSPDHTGMPWEGLFVKVVKNPPMQRGLAGKVGFAHSVDTTGSRYEITFDDPAGAGPAGAGRTEFALHYQWLALAEDEEVPPNLRKLKADGWKGPYADTKKKDELRI